MKNLSNELATLVNENGLRRVVGALVNLCREEARMAGTTWVGEANRQAWEHDANRLEAALCHMHKED